MGRLTGVNQANSEPTNGQRDDASKTHTTASTMSFQRHEVAKMFTVSYLVKLQTMETYSMDTAKIQQQYSASYSFRRVTASYSKEYSEGTANILHLPVAVVLFCCFVTVFLALFRCSFVSVRALVRVF